MIQEEKVTFELTVTAYYDGELDREELRQKLLDTLKNDNWDCSLNTVTNERLFFDLPASIVAFHATNHPMSNQSMKINQKQIMKR